MEVSENSITNQLAKAAVQNWSLKGCNVPEAEVNLEILNVGYRESWPSDYIAQGRQCADTVEKLDNLNG